MSMHRSRFRRFLSFAVTVTLAATALGGCATNATKSSNSSMVVDAPVQVVHTSEGNVGYRVMGSGPVIVLIMGYAGTMATWDPHFVDALARHFRVFIFDNAGLGRTAALRAPLSIDAMADQTGALIKALHLGAPDVLGWSMGSMIAQALAIRHPGQVRRLILCATFPGVGNAVHPSQKDVAALTGSHVTAAQADLFPPGHTMAADAFSGGIAAYPTSPPASASVITAQRSAILAWFDGRDPTGREAARISVPTLVADGANDRIDAAANDREVAAEVPGSRLVLYPGAGHAFLFQEGVTFTFLVRTFLAGVPPTLGASQIRQRYLAAHKISTAAGARWVSDLKSLTSSSTTQDVAKIDLSFADARGAFDDEMLSYGATGRLGTFVRALVNADELIVRDVLALAGQGGPQAKAWTTSIQNDGQVAFARENTLRRQLDLSPITTTTTTTTIPTL
jgi:pimeloyl-ACP methyl ester carboxylesterase